jgi:predicted ester cyclase
MVDRPHQGITVSNDIPTQQRLKHERKAVETLYDAFNRHDPDLLDQAVTPDWEDIPLAPGQAPGAEGLKPIIRSLIEAFPDVRITIHDLIQEPGHVAVRAEITGTHRGEIFGIAPTGMAVSFRIHEFHKLNGQRLTTTWHLEDWFGLFRQLGRFPSLTV